MYIRGVCAACGHPPIISIHTSWGPVVPNTHICDGSGGLLPYVSFCAQDLFRILHHFPTNSFFPPMPKNDPTPPGTPSSAGSVSSDEDLPATPPKGRVLLVLLDGTTTQVDVFAYSSVGFLRHTAARRMTQVSSNAKAQFDIVYNARVLHNDYTKIYDLCECYAADFVPKFWIVRRV
jgi:hypothetical protein